MAKKKKQRRKGRGAAGKTAAKPGNAAPAAAREATSSKAAPKGGPPSEPPSGAASRESKARILGTMGLLLLARGEVPLARDFLLDAMAIDRDQGNVLAEAVSNGYLAVADHLEGNFEMAGVTYRRSLAVLAKRGTPRMRATFLAWLGALEAEALREEVSVQCFEAAQVEAQQSSEPTVARTVAVLLGALHLLRARQDKKVRRLARRALRDASDLRDVDVVLARKRLDFLVESGLTVEG